MRDRKRRTSGIKHSRAAKLCLVTLVAVLGFAVPTGVAQYGRFPQVPTVSGPPEVINPQEEQTRMAEQMKQARNVMRQKKLVSQTALLQKLTIELNAGVARTDNAMLPDDVMRRSQQIEKLAKSIRELMIGPL